MRIFIIKLLKNYLYWLLLTIDKTIISLNSRFEQLKIIEYIFCFLFNFDKLTSFGNNKQKLSNLQHALKHNNTQIVRSAFIYRTKNRKIKL